AVERARWTEPHHRPLIDLEGPDLHGKLEVDVGALRILADDTRAFELLVELLVARKIDGRVPDLVDRRVDERLGVTIPLRLAGGRDGPGERALGREEALDLGVGANGRRDREDAEEREDGRDAHEDALPASW